MTRKLFEEWLGEFDEEIERQGRKVILFVDKCRAHVSPKLSSVKLMYYGGHT